MGLDLHLCCNGCYSVSFPSPFYFDCQREPSSVSPESSYPQCRISRREFKHIQGNLKNATYMCEPVGLITKIVLDLPSLVSLLCYATVTVGHWAPKLEVRPGVEFHLPLASCVTFHLRYCCCLFSIVRVFFISLISHHACAFFHHLEHMEYIYRSCLNILVYYLYHLWYFCICFYWLTFPPRFWVIFSRFFECLLLFCWVEDIVNFMLLGADFFFFFPNPLNIF